MMIGIPIAVRPNFAKVWPIKRELERKKLDYFIVHTGQHYSKEMSGKFLKEFDLKPKYNLEIGSGTRDEQIAKAEKGLKRVFREENPSIVYVRGDTNMVPAGINAAKKLKIKTIHEESGLRLVGIKGKKKFKCMGIEETNRIMADNKADYLIAHTKRQRKNLIREGINKDIFVTGSPTLDAIKLIMPKAKKAINKIPAEDYLILQVHKPYNVDNPRTLASILKSVQIVQKRYGFSIVFGYHARTENNIKKFGLEKLTSSFLKEGKDFPHMDYANFIKTQMGSVLVVTDSATLQEETCTLKVPCVTVSDSTDRPETLEVGSNCLAGQNHKGITDAVDAMINRKRNWKNPFGDGNASKRITKIIMKINN